MEALDRIAKSMREAGIRKLRVEADGAIELELADDSPPLSEPTVAPLPKAERLLDEANLGTSGPLCRMCHKVPPEGIIPGFCRPCGKRYLKGDSLSV